MMLVRILGPPSSPGHLLTGQQSGWAEATPTDGRP